jgi:hypothetical protein
MKRLSSTRGFAVGGVQGVLITMLSGMAGEAISGRQAEALLPRVRSESPVIAGAIASGIDRSPIFRRLITSIDASDGLLYLAKGECRGSARACLMHLVTISGPHRLLRIRVDLAKTAGCKLVASIGHELQHALEVLSDPSVRSNSGMALFFDRIGAAGGHLSIETPAAMEMGANVREEVCRRPTGESGCN